MKKFIQLLAFDLNVSANGMPDTISPFFSLISGGSQDQAMKTKMFRPF
jgi:hypothetical protein